MGRNKFTNQQGRNEIKRDKKNKELGLPDIVAWRQNLTERWGDLDAAARTARRTVLNSTFWADRIRSMA